jgi:hypothetical protein
VLLVAGRAHPIGSYDPRPREAAAP